MTFVTDNQHSIRSIGPKDPNFYITGPLTVSGRASIDISLNCPSNIAQMIAQAYDKGWITPVAHVTEKEYMFIGLSK